MPAMRRLLTLITFLLIASPATAQTAPALERFRQDFPQTIEVLAREFPADLDAIEAELASLPAAEAARGPETSFKLLAELRRKHAPRLAFAPAEALSLLLAATAEFHEAVFRGEGPEGCGLFARNGTGVLFQRGVALRYGRAMDTQATLFMLAVTAAIEQPEVHGEMSEADFAALLVVMAQAGLPEAQAKAIGSGDASDPDYCPAVAAMFRAASVFDTPQGFRVRADLAQNLAGY